MNTYGLMIEPTQYSEGRRGVIAAPETSAAGNVVLAVGRETVYRGIAEGWQKTEHVVLTPDEARALAAALTEAVSDGN